ncbi:MAG: Fur family transcriptional regulator [Shimia sp.]
MAGPGADPFHPHDHAACIEAGMARAEAVCAERGLRFSPVRRRVLRLLMDEHRAMGAYDVLAVLAAEGLGKQPPVAYRALDFLVANGLAHRIERLNAFVACGHPGHEHPVAFLICRGCDAVSEIAADAVHLPLEAAARAGDFAVERVTTEALGLCGACREAPA